MSEDATTCPRCGEKVPNRESRFCPSCGALLAVPARESDALVGKTLLDRYVVQGLIGRGGMGRVYLAEQRLGRSTRKVAIKVLSPAVTGDPSVVERFHREAAAILALASPSTVRLYDFGEQDGMLVLVMEHLAGERLAEVLARGPIAPARAVNIAVQIAGSLDEAHRRGIVHRDLKPENVILTGEDKEAQRVKVVDFGIAKHVAHDAHPTITAHGTLVGTPAYMAPEQFSGGGVDARSDIYALGLLTYQMLAGELPWTGRNVYEWATRHVRTPVPPLEEKCPGLPERVYQAVAKALEKLPSDRFDSAGEFARALTGIGPGADPWAALAVAEVALQAGGAVPRERTTEERATTGMATTKVASGATTLPGRTGPWIWLAVLFVVASGLGFGAVALLAHKSARQNPPRTVLVPAATDGGSAASADAAGGDGAATHGDGGDGTQEHPNWPRANQLLVDGLARAQRGDLDAALEAIETVMGLIGPTSVKLTDLRAATRTLGARTVRSRLNARRCSDAQALARRLRRAGAEGDVYRLFGRTCAAP